MGDRDDGEVLDRIELRLDQEGHAKPHEPVDHRPERGGHRLDREREARFASPKPQLLVDGVEHALDEIDRPLKHVHDPGEQPGDQVHMQLVEESTGGLERLFL